MKPICERVGFFIIFIKKEYDRGEKTRNKRNY